VYTLGKGCIKGKSYFCEACWQKRTSLQWNFCTVSTTTCTTCPSSIIITKAHFSTVIHCTATLSYML